MSNEQIAFPSDTEKKGPVFCLGMEFENDEKRRDYYIEKLKERLKDPEFREISGFPNGENKDILALSDPPYYTACPNPWINDFIEEWESQKPEKPKDSFYHREPFATDVSEGKNNPIYNAHSYHTKVPHKAIMRYILHYTEPGDIIFDGFCGTGMTGVAAQMCNDRDAILSLGYRVEANGDILKLEVNESGTQEWSPFSKIGPRKAILNDLSPSATFIAQNYNTPVNIESFKEKANQVQTELEIECGWMYETLHSDGKTIGKINFVIWSDIFICPECSNEIVFWVSAVDKNAGKVKDNFHCNHCNAKLNKRNMDRVWINKYDTGLKETVKQVKQVPVLINYSIKGIKGRLEKKLDEKDLALIKKIEDSEIPYWYPTNRMIEGKETRRNDPIGFTHINHFYTKRNLWVLSKVLDLVKNDKSLTFLFTGFLNRATKLNQLHISYYFFGGGGCNAGHRKGTLYAPSISMETPITSLIEARLKTQIRSYNAYTKAERNIISTASTESFLPSTSQSGILDYVFIDPPFGSNLNYSELSYFWEGWLKVFTNNKTEAIENSIQGKGTFEYKQLMTMAFTEIHRLLKPGRWITIEFSNTKAYVWNVVQSALQDSGFLVANVSSLDKKQGGMATIRSKVAVLKDLVISAYKPNGGFEKRFGSEARTEEGVWDFVRTHLKYLPVFKIQGNEVVNVPERDPRILFDQMVAYFVRKGFAVPISSQEFQLGLMQRFSERDGMFFLPEQVAEYDKKKMLIGGRSVQQTIFVLDESSAINWLRNLLRDKPQSFQEINPLFMKEIGGWSKYEKPLELSTLLEQNFLCYDDKSKVPEQIHGYLSTNWKDMRNLAKDDPILINKAKNRWYVPDPNKTGDLEKLREKSLLREFEAYKQSRKKLKLFRIEAVRAGFKKAWLDRDYATIISIAEKIPGTILEEDPKLLMWYDQAITRAGDI